MTEQHGIPAANGHTRGFALFLVNGQRYGVDLQAVQHVLPMVAITPLPGAPPVVAGVVDVRGEVVPVVDMRRRLGAPPAASIIDHHLLLLTTRRRRLALAVDQVAGPEQIPASALAAAHTLLISGSPVAGVARLDDGLVILHDVEAFLGLAEEAQLAASLGEAQE